MKSIWRAQIQNDGFVPIWHLVQTLCRQNFTVSVLIRRIQSCRVRFV